MSNFKIREFRKANGIYQEEMAQVIGLTQSNLSRYENNDIDLTEPMLNALREKYGEENVNAYLTDNPTQIRNNSTPIERKDDLTILDLVTIVKKQNETITKQVETQNEFTRQLTSINSRLLDLLEKTQFD